MNRKFHKSIRILKVNKYSNLFKKNIKKKLRKEIKNSLNLKKLR